MALIDIEASDVGNTGLFWLFFSYGCVLYYASNLISEGSDLLLLVPSMAGLVGSVVLPLLGAVPDGAIMLFSGLGDISEAQETLSVGVGALAGSTIMLLTVPWGLSIYGGRVDLDANGYPDYRKSPKLTKKSSFTQELTKTGVIISDAVSNGSKIMIITTIPYFLIQVPAFFIHGPTEEVAAGEKGWSLVGLVVCLVGFVTYLGMQFHISQQGQDKGKRVAVVKKLLREGKVSLRGALSEFIKSEEDILKLKDGYGAVSNGNGEASIPDTATVKMMRDIFREAFHSYDQNKNGTLDRGEVHTFLRDFHEDLSGDEMDTFFQRFDSDDDGVVSFDEFIGACYFFIKEYEEKPKPEPTVEVAGVSEITEGMFGAKKEDGEEEEEEEVNAKWLLLLLLLLSTWR
mmetsp:Transcript_13106/g.18843  ORF Transcript_13106/g.18843 Transcript_13106/m.18843 type:complete len:401 (-) Transcript_13106:169-1371(-)